MDDDIEAIAEDEEDVVVDANPEEADLTVKSASTSSDTNNQESEAEAAEREASIVAQIEFLESLPEERLIQYLEDQLELFSFPKQYTLRAEKLSEDGIKLFNRFLKVDSITHVDRKLSDITFTVKESRFDGEFFEQKLAALQQELERVRSVLDNREEWLSLYPQVVELMQVRAQVYNEIDELDSYLIADTSEKDSLKQVSSSDTEDRLESLVTHQEELFQIASDLRKKEHDMQSAMKRLDREMKESQKLGAAFDNDDTWMDDEARESLESLLAKVAADKKDDEDEDGDTGISEMMKRIRENSKKDSEFEENGDFEELVAARSKMDNEGFEEDGFEKEN